MSTIKACPFCNLGDRVLKQNDLAMAFLSNPRKAPGHFLVSPKRHVEKPWDLTPEEVQAIFELVFFIQKRVTQKLAAGCDVRQNYRPFQKQSRVKVDHVHYQLIPRNNEDQLYQKVEKYETALFITLPDDERQEMAKILQ